MVDSHDSFYENFSSEYGGAWTLRVFAFSCILLCGILLVGIAIYGVAPRYAIVHLAAKNGVAVVTPAMLAERRVLSLDGEWRYYSGGYAGRDFPDLGERGASIGVNIPMTAIISPFSTGAYVLSLAMRPPRFPVALHIPEFDGTVAVFLNGKRQPFLVGERAERVGDFFGPMFRLESFDAGKDHQELILVVRKTESTSPFYKKTIIIGPDDLVVNTMQYGVVNVMFIFGLLVFIILSGAVFMAMFPGHKIISIITFFDSLLALRILFGLSDVNVFLGGIFPGVVLTEGTRYSLQLLSLMLAGMVGAKLASELFDPENIIPPIFSNLLIAAYAGMAFLFSLDLSLFDRFGVEIILVIYTITFALVGVQFVIAWKRERSFYMLFQILKTSYLGVVICIDIVTFNAMIDSLLLFYAYALFFLCHVFIRLYDNNVSYRRVEALNKNLERTVADRTQALTSVNDELQRLNYAYKTLSYQDSLTGLPNRRAFLENGRQIVAHAARSGDVAFLLALDIDHFKQINDTWGHAAGDVVLREFATLLKSNFRSEDLIGRCGGEEFFVIMPKSDQASALRKAEVFRTRCDEHVFLLEDGVQLHVTVSTGMAMVRAAESGSAEEMLGDAMRRADMALYSAKKTGRNRVCNDE